MSKNSPAFKGRPDVRYRESLPSIELKPVVFAFVSTPAFAYFTNLHGMVGLTGLEPVTLRLSSACSNQLSYRPGSRFAPAIGCG